MTRKYWKDEDLSPISPKMEYLRAYTLKNGRDKGLREVQIQALADHTMSMDVGRAIEYFEELPSNFQKAFKTAWRQHQHKKKSFTGNTTVELTGAGKDAVARMVEVYTKHHPESAGGGLPSLRALALEWFLDTHCQEGVDLHNQFTGVTK